MTISNVNSLPLEKKTCVKLHLVCYKLLCWLGLHRRDSALFFATLLSQVCLLSGCWDWPFPYLHSFLAVCVTISHQSATHSASIPPCLTETAGQSSQLNLKTTASVKGLMINALVTTWVLLTHHHQEYLIIYGIYISVLLFIIINIIIINIVIFMLYISRFASLCYRGRQLGQDQTAT